MVARAVIRWIKSLFAWRFVQEKGVWHYYENAVTGARKAVHVSACWGPCDIYWLERRDPPPMTPPRGGSAVMKPRK